MPLRHPAAALAKANTLESPQNNSEVYKAHAEDRLSQRLTDRPTDRLTKRQNSFENMRMVSKCSHRSKQICGKNKCKFPTTRHKNQLAHIQLTALEWTEAFCLGESGSGSATRGRPSTWAWERLHSLLRQLCSKSCLRTRRA